MNLLQNCRGTPRAGRERFVCQIFCLSSSCIFFGDSLINKWVNTFVTPFAGKTVKSWVTLPLAQSLTIKYLCCLKKRFWKASAAFFIWVHISIHAFNQIHLKTKTTQKQNPNNDDKKTPHQPPPKQKQKTENQKTSPKKSANKSKTSQTSRKRSPKKYPRKIKQTNNNNKPKTTAKPQIKQTNKPRIHSNQNPLSVATSHSLY